MEPVMVVDDFDLEPATYRVLCNLLLEDADDLEYQVISDFQDPEEACDFAARKAEEMAKIMTTCKYLCEGKEVEAAFMSVETVIRVDGEEEYAGQIYNKTFYTKPVKN
jgi:hypothetical protein